MDDRREPEGRDEREARASQNRLIEWDDGTIRVEFVYDYMGRRARKTTGPSGGGTTTNHNAHISKETMEWLSWHPGRFEYVHTPKHGSWLNIVETLFGKMARTFLKGIRVDSKEELRERILQGIYEMNLEPAVHRLTDEQSGTVGGLNY